LVQLFKAVVHTNQVLVLCCSFGCQCVSLGVDVSGSNSGSVS
jgi:hypothetical protein